MNDSLPAPLLCVVRVCNKVQTLGVTLCRCLSPNRSSLSGSDMYTQQECLSALASALLPGLTGVGFNAAAEVPPGLAAPQQGFTRHTLPPLVVFKVQPSCFILCPYFQWESDCCMGSGCGGRCGRLAVSAVTRVRAEMAL